jgi:hypothetical protein
MFDKLIDGHCIHCYKRGGSDKSCAEEIMENENDIEKDIWIPLDLYQDVSKVSWGEIQLSSIGALFLNNVKNASKIIEEWLQDQSDRGLLQGDEYSHVAFLESIQQNYQVTKL